MGMVFLGVPCLSHIAKVWLCAAPHDWLPTPGIGRRALRAARAVRRLYQWLNTAKKGQLMGVLFLFFGRPF